jgi:hypothetical protein
LIFSFPFLLLPSPRLRACCFQNVSMWAVPSFIWSACAASSCGSAVLYLTILAVSSRAVLEAFFLSLLVRIRSLPSWPLHCCQIHSLVFLATFLNVLISLVSTNCFVLEVRVSAFLLLHTWEWAQFQFRLFSWAFIILCCFICIFRYCINFIWLVPYYCLYVLLLVISYLSIYLSIYVSVYISISLSIYGSTVLCWILAVSSVS